MKAVKSPYQAEFLRSSTDAEQFPELSVPEIAFLGRSNVGKSSLMNALVGETAARVSSTPGRTRAINFFALLNESKKRQLVFADLPGYGYAKISKSISSTWPEFIEPYLADRETLALCICLVDANIPAQESDRKLMDWLRHVDREFIVVATKADKLSGNQKPKQLAMLKSELGVDDILLCSSKTGFGIKDLWTRIQEASVIAS